jgi:Zn-dependent protease
LEAEMEEPRRLGPEEQPQAVRDLMDVAIAVEYRGGRLFRGRLKESPERVYGRLSAEFRDPLVPLLREDDRFGAAIALLPAPPSDSSHRRFPGAAPAALFAATLATTIHAGGKPFAVALVAILGLHELGHFLLARRRGMSVTLPYFIPFPFALGTLGAFIRMRSSSPDRKTLFDVGVAGPLAGLAAALPALILGLRSSTVLPGDSGGVPVGSSLLLTAVSKLSIPDALRMGHVLKLSPLAFAGWFGVWITAMNLLPIGQLDGGHIAHAMFGRRRGEAVGSAALAAVALAAALAWPALAFWALMAWLIAGRGEVPLDDLTPLPAGRKRLGWVVFALWLAIVVPLPKIVLATAGIG